MSTHYSEIRSLFLKCSSKTLQNLLHFILYPWTIFHFSFQTTLLIPYEFSGLCRHRFWSVWLGIFVECKPPFSEKCRINPGYNCFQGMPYCFDVNLTLKKICPTSMTSIISRENILDWYIFLKVLSTSNPIFL